jgi:hypothetical protein
MAKTKQNSTKGFSSHKPVSSTLSRQELLEVSQNISLYFAPRISSSIKKLVLLPIDPQHLYAYWSLGDVQNEALSLSKTCHDKVLRIYSQEVRGDVVKSKPVVDFKLQESQAKQVISLPVTNRRETYCAKIGEVNSTEGFVTLINSNTTPCFQGKKELIEIGLGDHILKVTNSLEHMIEEHPKSKKSHHMHTNYSGKGR